jgi:hypothetical protein
MSSTPSADRVPLVSPDRVREKVQAVLRAAQANGFTDADIEQLSGVSARCVKSYRVENREPSLSHALSILCVVGGLNPVLSLVGYCARPLDESDALHVNAVVAKGLQHFTVIAEAAADGRIDHIEAPKCQDAADQIIATVLPLSSAGQAA